MEYLENHDEIGSNIFITTSAHNHLSMLIVLKFPKGPASKGLSDYHFFYIIPHIKSIKGAFIIFLINTSLIRILSSEK